jgi:hypothetical protein
MVGTSAMRSPAVRHGMTARRNVATVRITRNRWAMREDFVWLRAWKLSRFPAKWEPVQERVQQKWQPVLRPNARHLVRWRAFPGG